MQQTKTYFVYIVSSKSRAIYIGVTSDLAGRIYQHRTCATPGHTARYHIDRLVYFESTEDVHAALQREKQLKAFRREKKVRLIESSNPTWCDLSADWF